MWRGLKPSCSVRLAKPRFFPVLLPSTSSSCSSFSTCATAVLLFCVGIGNPSYGPVEKNQYKSMPSCIWQQCKMPTFWFLMSVIIPGVAELQKGGHNPNNPWSGRVANEWLDTCFQRTCGSEDMCVCVATATKSTLATYTHTHTHILDNTHTNTGVRFPLPPPPHKR